MTADRTRIIVEGAVYFRTGRTRLSVNLWALWRRRMPRIDLGRTGTQTETKSMEAAAAGIRCSARPGLAFWLFALAAQAFFPQKSCRTPEPNAFRRVDNIRAGRVARALRCVVRPRSRSI